jgi:hypothetical protein
MTNRYTEETENERRVLNRIGTYFGIIIGAALIIFEYTVFHQKPTWWTLLGLTIAYTSWELIAWAGRSIGRRIKRKRTAKLHEDLSQYYDDLKEFKYRNPK